MADDQRQKTRVSPSGIRTAIKIARWAFSPGKMVFASIFGIMLSTFIFVTVFAGTEGGLVAVDIPPSDEEPPLPPDEGIPPANEIWDAIRGFGVSVYSGSDTSSKYDDYSVLKIIYTAYRDAFQSEKYRTLLTNHPTTIGVYEDGCSGYTHSYKEIDIEIHPRGCGERGIYYLTLHETGHRLRNFIQPDLSETKFSQIVDSDAGCYDNRYLKTYAYRTGGARNESFAEMAALYVMGGRKGHKYSILDFKADCPASYNYIEGALYGGY